MSSNIEPLKVIDYDLTEEQFISLINKESLTLSDDKHKDVLYVSGKLIISKEIDDHDHVKDISWLFDIVRAMPIELLKKLYREYRKHAHLNNQS